MKNIYLFLISCMLTMSWSRGVAQDVIFSFNNPQNTNNGGINYYEVDVMISSNTPFKLGSGQLYINYNVLAFGSNIFASGKIQMNRPDASYILAQQDNFVGLVDVYGSFTENDNTSSRYSILWLQSKEGDCIDVNVTATPQKLFHLRIEYLNINESPDICFESSALFIGQTFTHCGPNDGSCGLGDENCITDAGSQFTNETFLCPGSLLPLELVEFQVSKQKKSEVLLEWTTTNEMNTSHFEIERSTNASDWLPLGSVGAAGNATSELSYDFLDDQINLGDIPSTQFYYRLKMIDQDGSFEYSPLRTISFSGQQGLTIYPNPTSWGIYVRGRAIAITNPLQVRIYTLDGRMALQTKVDSTGDTIHFPIALLAGVYQVVIATDKGEEVLSKRVVLVR